MISKELLSDVLEFEASNIQVTKNTVHYCKENNYMDSINIHELAFKCKEWAERQDIILCSGAIPKKYAVSDLYYFCDIYLSNGKDCELCDSPVIEKDFQDETEPEAIFQACQYIKENL